MKTPDQFWKDMLTGAHPVARIEPRVMRLLPSNPRCKICFAPFAGAGGKFLALFGRKRWKKNPAICNVCQVHIERHHGGTEIDLTLLFADIRGSTALAEKMSPSEFTALLNTFYVTSTDVLVDHVAWIDKFVGDEVVAFFFPNQVRGQNHARSGMEAARALQRTLAARSIPIGIGVHTGHAYVGTVGGDQVSDVTAIGDDVNVASRLASSAEAGSIVVSETAWIASGLPTDKEERRELSVKGKSAPIAVRILRD